MATKLIFKSEDERTKAFNEIPEVEDAPPGVNMEKWRLEQEDKIDAIEAGEIKEDLEEGRVEIEDNPDEDKPKELKKPEEEPGKKEDDDNPLQQRVSDLERERTEMMAKFDTEKNDLKSKIKSFEEKKPEEIKKVDKKPEVSADIKKKEREISAVQDEIEVLEKEMNKIDDPFEEKYIKALKKTTSLSLRLNAMMSDKHAIELAKNTEEVRSLREDQKNKEEELQQKQEKKDLAETEKESRRKQVSKMNGFKDSSDYPEFKHKDTYETMEVKFAQFAVDLAVAHTGKLPNELKAADTEIAIQKYIDKTPVLLEKVAAKNLVEPEGMREFMVLSDINALRQGLKMDRATGEWMEILGDNGKRINLPTLDAAYDYYKKEHGITTQENLDSQRESARNAINATNQRANITELDETHQKGTIDDMSQDQAIKIINETNEEEIVILARKNIDSPKVNLYNKALKAMGEDPIEEGF